MIINLYRYRHQSQSEKPNNHYKGKYHYKTHVVNQGFSKGNNIVKYTNRAVNFMNKNAKNLKYTYSAKYNMVRWIGKDFSSTGYYTSLGEIITFILRG